MTPYISVELDFLNALSSPVFIKNMASVYVYCNRSFETFLGLSSEQILNQTSFKAASSSFTEIDIASEKDVLKLLMTGSPVKKIADILGISSYTVNDHLKSIYRKLGVHSKGAALYKMAGDKEALS